MRRAGFSLLELLVASAIAAALMGLGLGSYRAQMLRAHREEARLALRHAALLQEEHRALHGSYAGSPRELGAQLPWRTRGGRYSLHLNRGPVACEADDGVWRCFVLLARPRAAQARDRDCSQLHLDQEGHRGALDARGRASADRCWRR